MEAGLPSLKALAETFPDAARDIRLNLATVLQESSLTEKQRWGLALASALATRSGALRDAILQDGAFALDEAVIDDARAASSLMAMNNVFYRARHMIGKPAYQALPARLRMNRIAKPRGDRSDFELMCLAVSAIHGCETCVQSHEKAILEAGLTEAHVNDAVRIAATIHAAAVTLDSVATNAGEF